MPLYLIEQGAQGKAGAIKTNHLALNTNLNYQEHQEKEKVWVHGVVAE